MFQAHASQLMTSQLHFNGYCLFEVFIASKSGRHEIIKFGFVFKFLLKFLIDFSPK